MVRFGDYRVCEIEFVAAFDVDNTKVGDSLGEAVALVDREAGRAPGHALGMMDFSVQRGPTLDGLDDYQRMKVTESRAAPVDVTAALSAANIDVVICYLPTRSGEAAAYYAQAAHDAGAAFLTVAPLFVVETGKCMV
jgi:myo-inositol-1-phosphate synthase